MQAVLETQQLQKIFGSFQALKSVSLKLMPGEVHALMGENGAGKSTWIKTVTGIHRANGGSLFIQGEEKDFHSPKEAESSGVATVYQEVNLLSNLSVLENLCIGRRVTKWYGLEPFPQKKASRLLEKVGLSPTLLSEKVGDLSMATQQLIAIARALYHPVQLLILDEPTASLDEAECEALFKVMAELKQSGMAIVFVSHFLDQVYRVSDCMTVLRDGTSVGTYRTEEFPKDQLIEAMIGRKLEDQVVNQPAKMESVANSIMSVKDLKGNNGVTTGDMNFTEGEVVGVAGLLGSGRSEVLRMLFAADGIQSGERSMNSTPTEFKGIREAMQARIGFCSEDRKSEGIIPGLSVRENMLMALQSQRGLMKKVSKQESDTLVEQYVKQLKIKCPSLETPIENLSGGNQQKVLLARWLISQPVCLLLDEPTRGIDVGARSDIESLIMELSHAGMTFVVVSSELDELVRLCQRTYVMKDHRMIGHLSGEQLSENAIVTMIAEDPGVAS